VSSATLDTAYLREYFASATQDEALVVNLEGRMFPVEVAYLAEPTHDYVQKAVETALDIHSQVWHHSQNVFNFLIQMISESREISSFF